MASAAPRNGDARQPGVVRVTGDIGPAVLVEQFCNAVALFRAVLEQQHAIGLQQRAAIPRQDPNRIEAVIARAQCTLRLPVQRVERRVVRADIRWIGHDDSEAPTADGPGPVALEKLDIRDLSCLAFCRATSSVSVLMSVAVTCDNGRSFAMAMAIAPLPVPRSRMSHCARRGISRSARSTSSSVSGRGTSVAGVTRSSSDQNSRLPVM